MDKKKLGFKEIIIIIDVVVALFIAISLTMKVIRHNKQNNEIAPNNQYNLQFKGFSYNVPDNINFREDGEIISLEADNWKAEFYFLGDPDNITFDYHDRIKDIFISSGEHQITEIKDETIEGIPFAIYEYNDDGTNGLVCYFKTTVEPFVYEIQLHNKDNSLNREPLKIISKFLNEGVYDGAAGSQYLKQYIHLSKDQNRSE